MRIIFKLPPQFGSFSHPLAYVEWFTPLREPDPTTGMFHITRLTRNHHRNATIVSVDKIRRACHLFVKSGQEIDRTWTKDNVLELGKTFMVSRYINIDTFSTLYNVFTPSVTP